MLLHEIWHRNENQLLTPESQKGLRSFITKWQSAIKDSLEYKVYQAANRRAKASVDYDGEFVANAIEEAVNGGAGITNKLDNTVGGLLTPKQYAQVRTPEFKAWFGDWENDPKLLALRSYPAGDIILLTPPSHGHLP